MTSASSSSSLQQSYSKWDAVNYDTDEEEKAARDAEAAKRKKRSDEAREKVARERAAAMAAAQPPPKAVTAAAAAAARAARNESGPPTMMEAQNDLDPEQMTSAQKAEFADQYAEMFNRYRPKKQGYKFPDTFEEQKERVDAADALRQRGNAHFKQGELTEAAKLYEQATLKFADWYADCFATDEEKAMVHAVKTPSHLNLALCSWRLGNYAHAVVHCTQVLEREAHNPDDTNTKAYFRRGASHSALGNLEQAREDLAKAKALAPTDAEIRKEWATLRAREQAYREQKREMTKRMLSGAGADADPPANGTEDGALDGATATSDAARAAEADEAAEARRLEAWVRSRQAADAAEAAADAAVDADMAKPGDEAAAVAAAEAARQEAMRAAAAAWGVTPPEPPAASSAAQPAGAPAAGGGSISGAPRPRPRSMASISSPSGSVGGRGRRSRM